MFQFIKEAWLTYPYHCCAFKFPHTHNPWEFERHRNFRKQLQEACAAKNSSLHHVLLGNNNPALKTLFRWVPANDSFSHTSLIEDSSWNEDEEIFHNGTLSLNTGFPITTAVCGEIYTNYHEVSF